MTRLECFQHWLDRAATALDRLGQRLLALYQSVTAASSGIIPFRPVNPRMLGAAAAVAACLLAIGVLSGSYYGLRGAVSQLLASPSAEKPPQVEWVLRCSTCGRAWRVDQEQLDDLASRDGQYWCDQCRKYSVYRTRIGDPCIASPFYAGERP
jgi:hypothetical protein